MSDHIKTIEINGVKMDIDLRTAVVHRQKNLRVGSWVKVLEKGYLGTEVRHGIVVGFDAFKSKLTIIVARLGAGWNNTAIDFLYFNEDTKEKELIAANEEDCNVDRPAILASFDRELEKKLLEIKELEAKRAFFVKHFGKVVVTEGESADA